MIRSRKDELDKSITFHQVIMLALFGAFVSLASFIYQNEETMSNVVFFVLCALCLILVLMVAALYLLILKKIRELRDL